MSAASVADKLCRSRMIPSWGSERPQPRLFRRINSRVSRDFYERGS
jgi:hypothetical protein